MNDVGGVESFESSESLVDEVLEVKEGRGEKESAREEGTGLSFETNLSMVVRKILRSNDPVHIRLHELLDDCEMRRRNRRKGQHEERGGWKRRGSNER